MSSYLNALDPEHLIAETLVEEDALQARISELGDQISRDYEGLEPLLMDFMAVSSYGSGTDSSGVVRILKDLDANIEGRHVVIIEDIVDSGLTLSYLVRNLQARSPATLEVCALLTKPERRQTDITCRYVGFEIPNRFAIGYGLDYGERYRSLPYVAALDESRLPEDLI
jgi:hypoxanthine phosphoribosyltransferase